MVIIDANKVTPNMEVILKRIMAVILTVIAMICPGCTEEATQSRDEKTELYAGMG